MRLLGLLSGRARGRRAIGRPLRRGLARFVAARLISAAAAASTVATTDELEAIDDNA